MSYRFQYLDSNSSQIVYLKLCYFCVTDERLFLYNFQVEFHFVAFVEKDGHIYELDGRKKAPLNCGSSR
jgi:hypothetical protein